MTVARKTSRSDMSDNPWLRRIRNMYSRLEHDESKPLTWSVAVKRAFIVIPRTVSLSTLSTFWHNAPAPLLENIFKLVMVLRFSESVLPFYRNSFSDKEMLLREMEWQSEDIKISRLLQQESVKTLLHCMQLNVPFIRIKVCCTLLTNSSASWAIYVMVCQSLPFIPIFKANDYNCGALWA